MQNNRSIMTYGFAIFIMFFGSGNLVFPIQIGLNSGGNWLPAFFGLFCTGILLPLLGLFVIKIHKGNYEEFFAEGGMVAKIILPLFTLSLLGSFGVIPRCITVAYGGLEQLFPSLSLTIFSLIFCLICFIMCLKDKIMISLLGKWLTPLLLISLGFLICVAVIKAPVLSDISTKPMSIFKMAFKTGYGTMDLFAAFFFSSVIFKQIESSMPVATNYRKILIIALKASVTGAFLLSIVYLGFIYLGAHYAYLINGVSPALMLPKIASHILGDRATMLIGLIFVLSCLTTAVALNNIYARYLCSLLKLKEKGFEIILFCTTLIAFFVSLLDFKGIAIFLSPLLEISYPGIIALTFLSIAFKGFRPLKILVFYASLVIMTLYN